MERILFLSAALAAALAVSCARSIPDTGVSRELAVQRKADISDVRYALGFDIPEATDSTIAGTETVTFKLRKKRDVLLDAKGFGVGQVSVNGRECLPVQVNEHLKIPAKLLSKGANSVSISFTAGEQSINRRNGFLYTLLVPDRARTLFPCFDQPDMKARYTLSLTVPEGWKAVSNTSVSRSEGRTVHFAETEPLSTYLFSFAAGEFDCVQSEGIEANGKPIHLYHRETDPGKIAQCTEILSMVKRSIDWLEDYTGIPYPFAKYDLVVLPDFQYGGMEHTGATLYNDRRIFLGAAPTTTELLERASLIAHETAHMWFGDYVTMAWFDDVWTKEVFANFFAAKMARPFFPEVNHSLQDMRSYNAAAYSEDRTLGSNAIQRPLANLEKAGLIYCNIIYDKSPVVMGFLEQRLGGEAFRDGIREYLRRFGYSNATWDDLIGIFNERADFDVKEWSRVWVKEKGMPEYRASIDGERVTITQSDPTGKGSIWQQEIEYILVGDSCSIAAKAVFDGCSEVSLKPGFCVRHVIPNSDGKAYGRFRTGMENEAWLGSILPETADDITRMSILMTLYENAWHRETAPEDFLRWTCRALEEESNSLIRTSLLEYSQTAGRWCKGRPGAAPAVGNFEDLLLSMASDKDADHESRLQAFRTLMQESNRNDGVLLKLWETMEPFPGLVLSENDYTSLAYQLMLRFPEKASRIRDVQMGRISNRDRREAFLYISKACSADESEREDFFRSLLSDSTRGPESRVTAAMSLLNHPLRHPSSIRFIRPALDALEEVQRTGDIFFPSTWCSSLLSGYRTGEDVAGNDSAGAAATSAAGEVRAFIDSASATMDPLLMTKLLQKAGWLLQ